MELPGSNYLYTLAILSITYGGFVTLFILLSPGHRGVLHEYDAFLVRGGIQKAFIVTACAMLPPLLAYCALPEPVVWQISSVVAGVLQALFLVSWIGRRRHVRGIPTSKWLQANLFLQLLLSIYLFVAASALVFPPNVGAYLVGVTLILVFSGLAYQEAVIFLVHGGRR